jgi:hypothetical protein
MEADQKGDKPASSAQIIMGASWWGRWDRARTRLAMMRVGAVLLRAYRAPKVEKVSMTYAIAALSNVRSRRLSARR